jgi:hypothetical protein
MARRSRTRLDDELDDDRYEDEDELDERPARRSRRAEGPRRPSLLFWLLSRLLVVLILLAVLLGFAPWILSATGLWKPILAWAAPDVAGKVEIASLKLGWISGIDASGIVVRDPAGQTLAQIDRVASRKTLLEIVQNRQNLGTFDATAPKINVVLRADGSNVEDFLASLPKSGSSGPVGFGLTLNAGQVTLDDQVAGRKWQLDKLTLDLAWPAAAAEAKTGKFSAALQPIDGSRLAPREASNSRSELPTVGELAAEFSWQPSQQSAVGAGQAQVRLGGAATEVAEGALRRFVADIRPQGPLTVDATFTWADEGKSHHAVVKQLAAPQFSLAAPDFLSGDAISLAINSGSADVELAAGKLTIKGLALDSNLVQLSGRGSAEMSTLSPSALVASLSAAGGTGEVDLSGQIDLAELTRQLPGTLRLREGTEITSGVVRASVASKLDQGERRWQGSIKTVDLRATNAGRPIVLDQPLAVSFQLRQTATGPVIDQLVGEASFASLSGSGTLAEGTITADADLNKLAAEIGRLVDLGDSRLAGTLAANLKWSKSSGDVWKAIATARVEQFELQGAQLAPWREEDLQITAEATGLLGQASLQRLDAAKLTVAAAADRLEMELTEPVQKLSAESAWPAKFTLHGDLAAWAARLQPFVPLGSWRTSGEIDASGSGRFAPSATELADVKIQIEELAIAGPGLSLREPIVKIETAGAWDQKPQTLTLPTLTLASSSLAFRADNLRVVASPREPSATGLIDFRGDLGKLSGWLGDAQSPRTWQLAGAMTGRIEIGYRGQALEANWMTDIENLAWLAPPGGSTSVPLAAVTSTSGWETRWVEPRVSLSGQGTYDPRGQKLQLAHANLVSSLATLSAAGSVSELTGQRVLDLAGEVTYDLEPISQRLKASLAPPALDARKPAGPRSIDSLHLVGQEKRPFVIQGPLFATSGTSTLTPAGSALPAEPATPSTGQPLVSDQLQGEFSLGWQGAQYVGLIAGPADVRSRLDRGIVAIGPVDIPLSEGRLKAAPRILLNDRVPALVMDRGPLLEDVRISPEMCQLWLKYVAPMLADVTRAEGKFSLSLQGAAVPLAQPKRADAAGTLAIQTAQIGPSPLLQQYLVVAQQVRTLFDPAAGAAATVDPNRGWIVLPQQDVQFEVVEGGVVHRGFTMTVKDMAITTEGRVGIEDQSLNLLASVPIQESWLKKAPPYLTGLKGKTLQIPISGTISQPKLDARVLENLAKQAAGSAVQGVIDDQVKKGQTLLQDELGKGLNRLFGPLQPKPAPAPVLPMP